MDFKNFDIKKINRLFSKKSSDDLNRFLENLPEHTGKNILISAGVMWALAAGLGLYTSIQTQELITVREELRETSSLKPAVPKIQNKSIDKKEVEQFVDDTKNSYRGLDIKANGSTIIITGNRTGSFTEFREALGHMQNGGDGWRVSLEKLCVGRECHRTHKLTTSLKVNRVSVEK